MTSNPAITEMLEDIARTVHQHKSPRLVVIRHFTTTEHHDRGRTITLSIVLEEHAEDHRHESSRHDDHERRCA